MITRLELLDLHERLSAVLRRHQEWNVLLLRAAGRRHSIQDVVDTAAELAGGALFLLNAGCRVVFWWESLSGQCARPGDAGTGPALPQYRPGPAGRRADRFRHPALPGHGQRGQVLVTPGLSG